MITTILFDMDGVLFDSEPAWLRVHQQLFKKYKMPWSQQDYNENIRGRPVGDIFEYLVSKYNLDRKIKEKFLKERGALYLKSRPRMFTGVKEILAQLKKKYTLGLITSTDRWIAEPILKNNKILKFFEIVITGDEILRGKPDPWPYQHGMSILGSAPKETLIVEDSVVGVASAFASGAVVVAVTNTFPKDMLSEAHFFIGQITDLSEVLEQIK